MMKSIMMNHTLKGMLIFRALCSFFFHHHEVENGKAYDRKGSFDPTHVYVLHYNGYSDRAQATFTQFLFPIPLKHL